MMRQLLSFLRRDWFIETSYKFSFIFQFVGILFQVTLFYFISKFIGDGANRYLAQYGGNYFAFVLVGIAYQTYFHLALSGFSTNLRRDQMLGTLEMMLLAPTSSQRILALSASFNMLFTSFRIIIYLAVGALFFGLDLGQINILSCVVILILTIFSFSGLGILSAAFIMSVKRGDPVIWLFSMMNSLFGGVFFTIEVLPPLFQKLSFFLPMTHSLHAFRQALLFGASLDQLVQEIVVLFILGMVSLPLGFLAFRTAVRRAKRYGSLGEY